MLNDLVKQIHKYRKKGLLPMVTDKDLSALSEPEAEKLIYYAELGTVKPVTKIQRNRITIMIGKGFLPASYKNKLESMNSQAAQDLIKKGDLNAEKNQIAKEEV